MSSCTWKLIIKCLSKFFVIIYIVTYWATSLLWSFVHSCSPTCHCLCPEWWTSYHCWSRNQLSCCHQHLLCILQCEVCNSGPLPQLWMFLSMFSVSKCICINLTWICHTLPRLSSHPRPQAPPWASCLQPLSVDGSVHFPSRTPCWGHQTQACNQSSPC